MRDAVAGIEALTAQPATRSFWWTVGALLEALAGGGLEPGLATKQLAARIDMQIRRFVEGSRQVAERLRREVLYQVAISVPVSPAVREVQRAFRLAELLPSPEAASADSVRQDEAVRAGREAVGAAKEAWLALTSGRAEGRASLQRALTAVRDRADEAGGAALSRLAGSLAGRVASLPGSKVPEALALEYATALLLIESAFERRAGETPELAQEVDAMLARLDAVQAQRPLDAGVAAPRLDEMSKRAQERALLAQVTREIQVNLRHIEQVLDAFFRDPAQRAGLPALSKDIRQVAGALRMLGLDQAEGLLALCEAQIEAHATAAAPVAGADLELLAESLSCLGFYVEAVEQQRPQPERLIAPLLARRQGKAAAPEPRGGRRSGAGAGPDRAGRGRGGAGGRRGGRARTGDLGGDEAAARDRGQRARRRIPRHLPDRGRRGARHGGRAPAAAGRGPRRARRAAHGPARLPHAEGQRPDGGLDRARRARVHRRADPEPAAGGRASGHAGRAGRDRRRGAELPRVGRRAAAARAGAAGRARDARGDRRARGGAAARSRVGPRASGAGRAAGRGRAAAARRSGRRNRRNRCSR